MALHCPDSMTAIAGFYNEMTPAKLDRLGDLYGPGVSFSDPIQEAKGLPQLKEVLAGRFRKLEAVAIKVLDAHGDERTGFLLWSMSYRNRGEEHVIHGCSHFRFAQDGRISEQKDLWDASNVLYPDIPVLGWVMGKIKSRARIPV